MIDLVRKIEEALLISINENYSCVLINTSTPKYLIFIGNLEYPNYVAEIGRDGTLDSLYKNTQILWNAMPDYIPEPLSLYPLTEEESLLVQAGAPGIPWFSLRNHYQSDRDWSALTTRFVEAKDNFHKNVARHLDWQVSVNLSAELRKIAQKYQTLHGNNLCPSFQAVIDAQVGHLDSLGKMECHFQHGDFCINNMLVSDEKITILDFEHFGQVAAPYHDEFLLTSSILDFNSSSSNEVCNKVWEEVINNNSYQSKIENYQISSLFLYSVLWWLIESSSNPQRRERAIYYYKLLEKFCENELDNSGWRPEMYLT